MQSKPSLLLRRLRKLKNAYDADSAAMKLELLAGLERGALTHAREVLELHELLCFWRAYPDDAAVLERVERMLVAFADRRDLQRHRQELADTGIAGTRIYYRFFWPTARWLARRWPQQLFLDWAEFADHQALLDVLPLLLPFSETGGFDELSFTAREWIEQLKAASETDATFLVRRIEASQSSTFHGEARHDRLDLAYRLEPTARTPSRTRAKYAPVQIVYQTAPLDRTRPSLRKEIPRRPLAVRALSPSSGQRLIELAREAMVTRARDLDVFAYGNKHDVRLVDFGDGLQFACIGFQPERRLLLHAVYGFLTLQNGVPIGYVLASALNRAAEIAYNTFDTYRGAEAAAVFARVLAMAHHLFGAQSFSIDPYQLGYGNAEGLKSGAWWFYYKLGFRPRDPEVRRVLRGELQRMKHDPGHRSSIPTLRKLASEHVFFSASAGERGAGLLPLENISLAITRRMAQRFGAERERGLRVCMREAGEILGVRSTRGFAPAERQAWERWSPLIVALPGIERWSAAEKRALVSVVRAKGAPDESNFVHLYDQHRKLGQAVLQLAEEEDEEES